MAVGLLSLAYLVAFEDRMIISIVVEPIKAEFQLSDTQLGLLTGFAFVFFYSTFGIGLARLADRHSRKNIISISIVVWSAMTALTGLAQSFWQIFFCRLATGIGEAGVFPAGNSLISDYFPPKKRAAAIAVFVSGATVGLSVGLMFGGYIAEHYGWRSAFIVLGLLGAPVALLNVFLLEEPKRGMADNVSNGGQAQTLGEVCKALVANKTYVQVSLAVCYINFMIFGVIQWMPALMIRKFGLSISTVGTLFGVALGCGSALGSVVGGLICNKLAQRDIRWLVRFPFIVSFCYLPLYEWSIYSPSSTLSILAIFLVNIVGGSSYGPIIAVIQSVVAPSMRATASAIYVGLIMVIGSGGAPFVIGWMSDVLRPGMGDVPALQMGLAVSVLVTSILVLVHLHLSRRDLVKDLVGTPWPSAQASDSVEQTLCLSTVSNERPLR